MTLREKIADWLTGGELAKLEWQALHWNKAYKEMYEAACEQSCETESARDALRAIIARGNTASPNSTVKAMQKIAREALEK